MFEEVFNVSLTDDKKEMISSEYEKFKNNDKHFHIIARGANKSAQIERWNFYQMYWIMRGKENGTR